MAESYYLGLSVKTRRGADVLVFNKETGTGLFKGQIQNYFRVSVEVVVSWGRTQPDP